jgi:D-serine deaminase-like pyridoxal phosphate-dependent protein
MLANPTNPAAAPRAIEELQTPCLLLEEQRMDRNIARLKSRLQKHRIVLRPHLKTAKSIEVARRLMPSTSGPATVSTLREAEEFAAAGVRDIFYAVGIAPGKLDRVVALRARGIDLSIVVDSIEQATAVAAKSRECGVPIPTLVEIDSDGHRAGIRERDSLLLEIGRVLHDDGAELRGVMTHAGGSYDSEGAEALERAAERERAAAVGCADALRAVNLPCPVVSVGSTPTAHFARDLTGVTEVRAGVFVFFDLVMVGIGVCKVDDIALSVLSTVIGHQREKGWIVVDAGWMAMSRDRGTAKQRVDQGYGVACDLHGRPYADLIMRQANQEHGILELRPGSKASLPSLAIGSQVRILPNHACATGAQHERYVVLGPEGRISGFWRRFSGW